MNFKWKRLIDGPSIVVILALVTLLTGMVFSLQKCGEQFEANRKKSELCLEKCKAKHGWDVTATWRPYDQGCICDLTHRRMDMK